MGRQLRRVPLDFAQPLNKVWPGFLMPDGLHEQCPDCQGSGSTAGKKRLDDLVHLLMASGSDAARGQCHPYFQGSSWGMPLHNSEGLVPTGLDELTGALAGRSPRGNFGHDSSDGWRASSAIIKAAGLPEKWGYCKACEGHGETPESRVRTEAWQATEPPTGDGWQMWETVSEGSPISPVFSTPEALATWLSQHHARDGNYEQWLAMIVGSGWAPSMIATPQTGFVSGVAGMHAIKDGAP